MLFPCNSCYAQHLRGWFANGRRLENLGEMKEAAQKLQGLGCSNVIIKGGHLLAWLMSCMTGIISCVIRE